MATIEYWIQLQNRPWDVCPNNIERMHGGTIQQSTGEAPVSVHLRSPGTGRVTRHTMFRPTRGHALILRRYRPPEQPDGSDAWTVPDDRKVNPWDVNEPDPTDDGTMIGFLIVHNPDDPDDVIAQDLPGGDVNGSPIFRFGITLPGDFTILPHDLEGVVPAAGPGSTPHEGDHGYHRAGSEESAPPWTLRRGGLTFELGRDLRTLARVFLPRYRQPPQRAQYLQLFHELDGSGSCINGRQFLGNTPTVVGGLDTKMRFGLGAMDNLTFHTFHLHGHRWLIPGPVGMTAAEIEVSAQTKAVSQFEDTKIFGPAETFSFTIDQGSAMGGLFRDDPSRAPGIGEWHMHCHVLHHARGNDGLALGHPRRRVSVPEASKRRAVPRARPDPAQHDQGGTEQLRAQ